MMVSHAGRLGLLAVVLTVSGCTESGPRLGTATGMVTLDGRPLSDADIEFMPREGRGSMGVTDGQGRYELFYTQGRKGVLVGTHTVRIGNGAKGAGKTPARYNRQSELTVEVKSGKNEFNFDLDSK